MTKQTRIQHLQSICSDISGDISKGGLIGKNFTFGLTGAKMVEQFRVKRLHFATTEIETKYVPKLKLAAKKHNLSLMLDHVESGFAVSAKEVGHYLHINQTILIETKRMIKNAKKEILLTSPYFITEPTFFIHLVQAANYQYHPYLPDLQCFD